MNHIFKSSPFGYSSVAGYIYHSDMEPALCLCDTVHIGAVRALAVVAGDVGNRTLPTANDATDGVYERPPDTGQSPDRMAEIVRWREGADLAKLEFTY